MQCLISPGKVDKGRAHRDVLALVGDASRAGTMKGVGTKRETLAKDKRMSDYGNPQIPPSHCGTQGLSTETTPAGNRLF